MRRWLLLMMMCSPFMTGCSRKVEIEKTTVSGTVTYNAQPIEKGEIRFIPKAGTEGPMATGAIVNGDYTVTAAGGVPIGDHKVEIMAYIELPKPANAPPIAPTPREQYIPEKYNTKTELDFTVPSGGETKKDFALEGPPQKK
ncbi:MAG: hypothetical protein O3A29_22270 [Planctomycetota bacterium]|nr:hypothetical protein [Planctomycetota bacterium]